MAVEEGNGGHRIGQEAAVELPQHVPERIADADGVGQVQPVGVEFGKGGGGDYDAWGNGWMVLYDIEGLEQGGTEGGSETVVWWGVDGQEIMRGHRLGSVDGTARMVIARWYGERK